VDEIEVWVRKENDEAPPQDLIRRGFPQPAATRGVSGDGEKISLSTDRLGRQFHEITRQLGTVIQEAIAIDMPFRLDQVKVAVEINAEGSVSLLGFSGGKVGGRGGLELTFKRKG